jgi:hypothetical protein
MTFHRKNIAQTSTDSLEADTRATGLSGPSLILARVAWIVIVMGFLALFVASLPPYFVLLSHPCTGSLCQFAQLIPASEMPQLRSLSISLDTYAASQISLQILLVSVFVAVAAVIFWRKSADPVALLGSFTIAMFGILFERDNLSLLPPLWALPVQLVSSLSFTGFFIFFYLFPNGQFVPRWTRWLAVGSLLYWLADIFLPVWQNSLLNFVIFLGFVASLFGAQVYRYRRVSTPRERQQTKWVVLGAIGGIGGYLTVFTVLFIVLGDLSHASNQPPLLLLLINSAIALLILLFPLSIGFAMLRYRLWEIDILINRALVYSALTITLGLAYAALIIGLQFLLHGIIAQSNEVVLVGTTLVIAALFQPLRRRIQQTIDRRFYRRKYDAAKTLSAFSATLREEVDLAQLSEQLVAVVRETMQPAHVSLWLRPTVQERQRTP